MKLRYLFTGAFLLMWCTTTYAATTVTKKCVVASCDAGYYASGSVFAGGSTYYTGCTRCPALNGVYGTTSAGMSKITDCAIPAGRNFSDSAGTWSFTQACKYSN